MIPRPILTFLVFALPLLTVSFGVLMGGYALAQGTGDMPVANVLRSVALACLLLLVVDLVLLVGALGAEALARRGDRSDRDEP